MFDIPIGYTPAETKPTTQYVEPYSRRPGGGFDRSKESYFNQPQKQEEEPKKKEENKEQQESNSEEKAKQKPQNKK
jgi:hypothetical protein